METEFPGVPTRRARKVALQLLPWCEHIFSRYDIDDSFYANPDCSRLATELTAQMREYLPFHGIQQKKAPRR